MKEKKYNLEDCDILDIDGNMLLVCYDSAAPHQKVLAFSDSTNDFNEKAMKFFDGDDWMDFLFYMDEKFPSDLIDRLIENMYDKHSDTYMRVFKQWNSDIENDGFSFAVIENGKKTSDGHRLGNFEKDSLEKLPTRMLLMLADAFQIDDFYMMSRDGLLKTLSELDVDIDEDNEDDNDCGYKDDCLELNIVRTDNEGHRWATFNKEDVENLDDDTLYLLAEDMNIPNADLKTHMELVDAICAEESDIDSDEYDWVDGCNRNCDDCEYADLNDDKDETIEQGNTNTNEEHEDSAQSYESVNGPQHYNGTECIENMRKLYGDDAVRWFCICNAYKYRFREGDKPGAPAKMDEDKARWYENYAAKMMSEQHYY